jgi:uncharacterized protein
LKLIIFGDKYPTGLPIVSPASMGEPKMMYIHIEQIGAESLDLQFEEKPQNFPVLAEMIDRGECEFFAPIKTFLRAVRIADRVEVEADVRTAVGLSCGRCLKVFKTDISSHFTLTYTPRREEVEVGAELDEIELRPDEINRIYFEGERIDLQDAVQEQVIMAFPIRALCNEACRGLCPQCGADLNEGDCGCARQMPESRFAVLKNFRPRKA